MPRAWTVSVSVALALFLVAASAVFGQEVPPPNPQDAFALIKQAEARIAASDFDGAMNLLAKARLSAPELARIPFIMATCEYNLGIRTGNPVPSERAWKLLEEAMRLDPDWGEPWFFGGVMNFSAGNYEDAAKSFQGALARAYRPKQSRVNLAFSLFKWGVLLSGADRPPDDLPKGIRIFIDSVDRFAALKDDLRFSKEERDQFAEHWTNSLTNLVAMLQRDEQYAEAEKILNGLIEAQPGNHLHHFNLGLVLGGTMKNWDRALEEYRKSLELCDDPDWMEPYPMIGYILSERSRSEEDEREAEKYFLHYLERHPNAFEAHSRAGDHYKNTAFRQGVDEKEKRAALLEKAAQSYVRCLEIQPRLIPAMQKLTDVLRVANRTAEADRWKALLEALK